MLFPHTNVHSIITYVVHTFYIFRRTWNDKKMKSWKNEEYPWRTRRRNNNCFAKFATVLFQTNKTTTNTKTTSMKRTIRKSSAPSARQLFPTNIIWKIIWGVNTRTPSMNVKNVGQHTSTDRDLHVTQKNAKAQLGCPPYCYKSNCPKPQLFVVVVFVICLFCLL